ncbi:unnamed protein product [marine sediment metagenome]|uniref:Leucine-binding protein domain-containing protein n=1 Tax=marine sediment metagenome TaxID=412755 RepID=X0U5V5_9ZZZZ
MVTVAHESEQGTYASELGMALEGEPDVLVAISYPESATIFLKEAIEGGFAGKFLFVDGTKSPEMIGRVGSQYLNGSFGTAPSTAETDAREAFKEAYSWVYGEMPPSRPFIGEAYDATVLIALAIQKAGKADGSAIRDALWDVANPPGEKVGPGVEGIKKALQLIKDGKDIDYDGAAGPQDFDQFGDVVTHVEIWTIQEGKIKTVRYEMP